MNKLLEKYPSAYAVYDIGKYYGVCVEESFYFVDKNSYNTVKSEPRYDKSVVEIIESAIPIWFAND